MIKFIFCFLLLTQTLVAYERFIGLGNSCLTRRQIDQHLEKRFNKDKNSFGGGQLFDWLFIHNYEKLAEAIENNLEDHFAQSDLKIIREFNHVHCVKNMKYDMTWIHLFSRPFGIFLPDNTIDKEYNIREQKIHYLSDKFRKLANYRTLYIISQPYINWQKIGMLEPDQSVLIHLRDALIQMRGNDSFDLLYCPLQKKFDETDHIYIRQIRSTMKPRDDFNCWDEILSAFPFEPEPNAKIQDDNRRVS